MPSIETQIDAFLSRRRASDWTVRADGSEAPSPFVEVAVFDGKAPGLYRITDDGTLEGEVERIGELFATTPPCTEHGTDGCDCA